MHLTSIIHKAHGTYKRVFECADVGVCVSTRLRKRENPGKNIVIGRATTTLPHVYTWVRTRAAEFSGPVVKQVMVIRRLTETHGSWTSLLQEALLSLDKSCLKQRFIFFKLCPRKVLPICCICMSTCQVDTFKGHIGDTELPAFSCCTKVTLIVIDQPFWSRC